MDDVMMRRSVTTGFTLLETLVVLVITGLVSLVLVQGLGLVLAARTTAQDKVVDIDEAVLRQNLFLEPLRGILPDYPERANIFAGEARRLHGLTARPLQGRTGTPVGFALSMDYDSSRGQTSLTYQEQNAEPLILGYWEGADGAFSYRDRTGQWSETWPPSADADVVQTPWLVRVEMGSGFPSTLIAHVDGAHQRRLRFMDTPYGNTTKR
jgi:type II secretory pathway component PulJ